jgi:hypothetical protein
MPKTRPPYSPEFRPTTQRFPLPERGRPQMVSRDLGVVRIPSRSLPSLPTALAKQEYGVGGWISLGFPDTFAENL